MAKKPATRTFHQEASGWIPRSETSLAIVRVFREQWSPWDVVYPTAKACETDMGCDDARQVRITLTCTMTVEDIKT